MKAVRCYSDNTICLCTSGHTAASVSNVFQRRVWSRQIGLQLRSSARPRAQRKSIPSAQIAASARRMSMSAQSARQSKTQAAGSALFAIGNLFVVDALFHVLKFSLARAQVRASSKVECACFCFFVCIGLRMVYYAGRISGCSPTARITQTT
jgi:hypothetical protein